ncbi:hypothetical protein EJV47_07320 [Hymenobacter gummosus]|uniref:Multidrug transporter n=1 Tax=Hymenobacter gummosus TaxID=1776032 RepID=A0A3S0JIY3_9BACT|nr:bestrophin family ion channel [Hymenobacter gummosus]RTQ51602.1 hypothetical protein EJV47_07320 [Hymenobacter gummosus]
MYVNHHIRPGLILRFAWKNLLLFLVLSAGSFALYSYLGCRYLAIPFLPIGVIGTAVAFYIGFKNNSSYERLWEARRIWGSITNNSRAWGVMALDFVNNDFAPDPLPPAALQSIRRELLYRQLGLVSALRHQLRRPQYWQSPVSRAVALEAAARYEHACGEDLRLFLPEDEVATALTYPNTATHLIRRQSARLLELRQAGLLNDFRHLEMARMLNDMYNQQGACERIKSFPLPRQYAYFSAVFTWLFIVLLPFGMLGEFAKVGPQYTWLMIPFHLLISWVFMTMETIGDTSENPFENGINDVPMTAINRNIEIDLRAMLGETDLPPRVEAVDGILL